MGGKRIPFEVIRGKVYYEYTIESGDTLSTVCYKFGYPNWEEIYKNEYNASFRSKYSNPHKIYPDKNTPFYIPARHMVVGKDNNLQFANNSELGKCCVFWPAKENSIDKLIPENVQAQHLKIPDIGLNEKWSYDGLIDAYAQKYGFEELTKILFIVGKKGAGLGYRILKTDYWFEEYKVDHNKKEIYIDAKGWSDRTNTEAAKILKDVVSYEFEGKESFWGCVWRIASGLGLTMVGVGEMAVGVIGIIVPEPGTTAAGVAVTVFGASTTVEGVTKLFNVNDGKGFNPIEEGFALVGNWIGGNTGETIARISFVFVNLIVSLGGSYKILKIPGQKFIFKGTYTGKGFTKFYSEGFTIGRLQLNYPLGINGKVIINVTNNSNQWIFRFQQINKTIVMNGRIINLQNWHCVEKPIEMIKVLLKLAKHGF